MLTKNVKIMLVLLLVAFLYVFVFGCDDTVDNVTITIDGEEFTISVEDDGEVKELDSAIEKVAEPVLDFGDSVVEAVRDAEENFLSDIFNKTDPKDDPNDLSMEGFFGKDDD